MMKRMLRGLGMICSALVVSQPALAGDVDPAVLEEGKALFQTDAAPACAICHTLADAGTTGTIGPDLDELGADANRIRKALKEGMGAMPAFEDTLSEEQREAIVAYVTKATGVAE